MSEPEIVTFGCRLNAYESEVMRAKLRHTGATNAVIFNTCAVTAEATRQARQAIRRARREKPGRRTPAVAASGPEPLAVRPLGGKGLGRPPRR